MAFQGIRLPYKSADQLYFRLSLIFYLMAAVPMVPFVVIYLSMQDGSTTPLFDAEYTPVVTIALAVLAFGNVVLGMRFYKKQLVELRKEESLRAKLDLFVSASILQYSCMEAATIIAVVGLYATRTTFFVLLYLGMLIIFAQVRPELRRISKQLKLSKEEEDVIYQKKDIA